MNELDELRAEVAQLREACRLMFALTTSVLAASSSSAQTLAALMANIAATNKAKNRGDDYDAMCAATLMAVSSIALQQHPNDRTVQATYNGLRPGGRH